MNNDIEILPAIPDVPIVRDNAELTCDSSPDISKQVDKSPTSPGVIPDTMKVMATAGSSRIQYTRSSMTEVVQAAAHMLAYFSDKDHPGLNEPRNVKRQVPGTGVLVQPRLKGQENMVGFQFFFTNNAIAGHATNKAVGIAFDFEVYESIGDRYMFNILKQISELVKTANRPSDEQLKQLSTRFSLSN